MAIRYLAFNVSVIDTASRRVCAFCMFINNYRLLNFFVNVYMPCEGDDASSNEFVDQLFVVENIICNHLDSHIIIGGDLNVDFGRNWAHTAVLRSFCDNVDLCPIVDHSNY